MIAARNDGDTALNRPSTANPANAAMDAVTNTARTSAGIDNRWKPIRLARSDVSGAKSTLTAAMAINTMCRTNDSFSGAGAYCTRNPASSGPKPRPPMLATVATAGARACQPGGAASITAAVAVPVAAPADRPDSSRPSKRSSTPVATRNTPSLPNAKAMASSKIGLRPTASDQRPNARSAASTPTAYVANTTVVVSSEKCMRCEYSAYIGVGSVVPSMSAVKAYANEGKASLDRQRLCTPDDIERF